MQIVMVDANTLIEVGVGEDKARPWEELRELGVAVKVTDVAVMEAVAHMRRGISEAREKSRKALYMPHVGLAPDDPTCRALAEHFDLREQALAEEFNARLAALGVSVIPVPDVPHTTLVERSVSRMKPNDDRGDGYRDTLHWFAILDEARPLRGESEIIWVTRDSDFGKDVDTFHPDLVAELENQHFMCQVTRANDLRDVVQRLKHEKNAQDLLVKEVEANLSPETLYSFACAELLADLSAIPIDAGDFGLPATATEAALLAWWEPDAAPRPLVTSPISGTNCAMVDLDWEAPVRVGYLDPGTDPGEAWQERMATGHFRATLRVDESGSPQQADSVIVRNGAVSEPALFSFIAQALSGMQKIEHRRTRPGEKQSDPAPLPDIMRAFAGFMNENHQTATKAVDTPAPGLAPAEVTTNNGPDGSDEGGPS